MTEQEAIKELKTCVDLPFGNEIQGETAESAITAFEEIQKYRALGTVRQIEDFIADWRKYRELGNLEELREAVEKQRAKKPNIWGDGYDDKGNMIYDMYDCPNCGKSYELDYEQYDYCPHCGQHIDWSEGE